MDAQIQNISTKMSLQTHHLSSESPHKHISLVLRKPPQTHITCPQKAPNTYHLSSESPHKHISLVLRKPPQTHITCPQKAPNTYHLSSESPHKHISLPPPPPPPSKKNIPACICLLTQHHKILVGQAAVWDTCVALL